MGQPCDAYIVGCLSLSAMTVYKERLGIAMDKTVWSAIRAWKNDR